MLVNFQTFFAVMSRNELDLAIGKAPSGQIGDHLMAEEMRMDMLDDACLFPVVFDDLLDAPWRERGGAHGLKEVAILGVGAQMTLQNQAKTGREQNIAILPPFPVGDKDLALGKVDICHFDVHQFTYPYG